jgi:hypothetical protein
MQSGWDRPGAGARWVGVSRNCGRLSVLLLGFMLAACGNLGQIGNLNQLANLNLLSNADETPRVSVAFESVDGPPPAVHERFMRVLKDEAGSRRLAVVTSADANYRLRGYLATHPERGATAISWAWDVYDSGQRRTFRLKGEDNAAGSAGWSNADDEVLRRIARSALDQFAGLTSGSRQAAAASEPKKEPSQRRGSTLAWLDDWAPETAGIFRILRNDDDKPVEAAALPEQPQPGTVPMPRGRPGTDRAPSQALAYASAD